MKAIPAEIALLLSCARVHLGTGHRDQVHELVRHPVNWFYLLRMARRHRLRPILYKQLNGNCPDAVPSAVLTELQQGFHESFRRNLRLTRELFSLLELFRTENIEAVPYKGPAIAHGFFGHLALREFTDLDIMVSEKDVPRITGLLRCRGYERQFQFGRAQESAFLRHQCEHRFHHADDDIFVDIHWRFAPRYFCFDPGPLRLRLQELSISGREMPVYSAEDQFLLLSVHGCKHLWQRLLWICDLAQIVEVAGGLDWDSILSRARYSGVERMTLLGVFLAHELFNASFPPEVLRQACRDQTIKLLAETVQNNLTEEAKGTQPGLLAEALFHLNARERKRDRFRYSFRLAVTPTSLDWSLLPLPAGLSFVYYAIRPFRLAVKHALARPTRRKRNENKPRITRMRI
jgi:hypothetical protein